MKFDLASLLLAIEASTPDGRWNLLQGWLKENPDYGDLVDEWSHQSVDQVFSAIRDLIIERYEPQAALVRLVANSMETRIKSAIEILQTCYRERNNHTEIEKEIKDVRTGRQVKGRSTKNHRRTNARARRAD